MSIVTDPARNRIVFCEGEPGGPDIMLWQRILIGARHPDASNFRIELKPIGGKQAAKNFARGYQLATSNDNWLIVRDRDLDVEQNTPNKVETWNKVLLTGGTSIESYFLSADLLERFTTERNIPLPANHDSALHDTLRSLRDYQAVRWALQRVRKALQAEAEQKSLYRTVGVFDLPNRLTNRDGELPNELDLSSCTQSAEQMIEQFQGVFHGFDGSTLQRHIDFFKAKFDGDDFWSSRFQQWFHGKDVLYLWLRSYNHVNPQTYSSWAAQNLEWQQFPDLIEIQRICQTE